MEYDASEEKETSNECCHDSPPSHGRASIARWTKSQGDRQSPGTSARSCIAR